jgi:AcrR family transcriptional regulator
VLRGRSIHRSWLLEERQGETTVETTTEAKADGSDFPVPSWRQIRRRVSRKTPLTRDAIVDAALRVLDQEGVDAVSMRRVGEELGTGAATLYWHIGSKDELLDLVLDRAFGELDVPEPDPARWEEQLKELARQGRSVMKQHRDLARLSLGRIPTGPNLLRMSEALLGILRTGTQDRVAAFGGDLVALLVGAYVFEESLASTPVGDDAPSHNPEMVTEFYASLPADRFPNVVALTRAGYLTEGDADERFEFGIDVLIRGLRTMGDQS